MNIQEQIQEELKKQLAFMQDDFKLMVKKEVNLQLDAITSRRETILDKNIGQHSTLNMLLDIVCDIFQTTPEEMLRGGRKRHISDARTCFVGVILRYEAEYFSSDTLGRFLNKDHATVLHHKNKYRDMIEFNKPFNYQAQVVNVKFRNKLNQQQ